MAERISITYNPNTKLNSVYRRAMPTQEEIDFRNDFNERRRNHTLSDEELSREKRRQRGSHVANDIKNLLLSHEFRYFNTFTSNVLALDARALLKAVQEYLIEQNTPFLCILEAFYRESDGFHVHAFTDKKINFENWYRKYGGIKVDSKSEEELRDLFGEHWNLPVSIDGVEVNLYSEKIQDYAKTRSYSIKKISITKDRLPLYTPIYKHNLTNDDNIPNVKINAIIDDNGELIINHVNEIGEYLIRKNEAISNGISERAFILEELAIIRRLKTRYIFTNRNFPKSKQDLLQFIKQDLEKYNQFISNSNNIDDINHNSNTFDNNICITNVENTEIINDLDYNVPNIHNIDDISKINNITNITNINISNISSIINDFHVPNTENVHNFDVLSAVPTAFDCRTDCKKFSYVCVGTKNRKKFDDFGIKKSNTETHSALIPFENAMEIEENLNFANYLRLYIGYIEHIPD